MLSDRGAGSASGKLGGFGQPAEALKIAAESKEGFAIVKGFLLDFWDSEMAPDNWVTLMLAVAATCSSASSARASTRPPGSTSPKTATPGARPSTR